MRPLSSLAMSILRLPVPVSRRISQPSYRPGAFVLGLALATLVAGTPASAAPEAAEASASSALTCETLPRLLGAYLQNHLQYRALTTDLKDRVAETNLRHLDPSRSLFVQADIDSLRRQFNGVFTSLSLGDCAQLEAMHKLSIERYKEMEKFVRDYVSRPDYEIDKEATLVIDPEKRGFPKDKTEREDLYRRLVHFQMSNFVANDEPMEEAKKKLIHRYELMTRRATETKRDEIYARFLNAFASSLDPHSAYLTPENNEDFKIHMGLSLQGIGAVLSSRDGYTVVEEVVLGGPADRSGQLKKNDKIVAVGQANAKMVDVIDMELREVVQMIRGEKGTPVRIAVLRPGDNSRKEIALVRDKINLEEQAAKLRFEDVKVGDKTYKLAVLDLPSFYGDKDTGARQATDDVQKLLKEARAAKADGLLLDLSRNGGGLLDYAVKITGFFIGKGGVVAVGDSQDRTQVLEDPDDAIEWAGPLVVLTSHVTASAAEIFAGAVKDYRRGVIVGDDHTFGKGSVQTVAPLPPGLGALKFTTALFYRPGGKSTQQIGVPADIIFPALTATDELSEKSQHYSLPARSIEAFANGTPRQSGGFIPIDDATLQTLAQLSRERVVSDTHFADIEKELAKQKANEGVVKVADLLEKKEKDKEKEAAKPDAAAAEGAAPSAASGAPTPPGTGVPGEDEAPDDRAPQIQEALRILGDLVSRRPVAMNN